MSKLEEILQAEVGAEIDTILAEADSRAAKIVTAAESRAAGRVAEHRKRIDAAVRAAAHQAQSAADLTIANARIQAKGEVMDQLGQQVRLALTGTSSQPNYGEVLQALAQEALGVAEPAEAVVVHPEDQENLRAWAEGHGLELRSDPELHLGVRIVSQNGSTVENTLPERLQRAWETLAPQVTRLLWE